MPSSLPPPTSLSESESESELDYLQRHTRWIRDILEPQVSQNGPDSLQSDDILTADEFLRSLDPSPKFDIEVLQTSRIHFALLLIAKHATRWPSKLVDRCDDLIEEWTHKYGPLEDIRPQLLKNYGRLAHLYTAEDMFQPGDQFNINWVVDKIKYDSYPRVFARHYGHQGFHPGDWWIDTLFAFRSGIVDRPHGRRRGGGCFVSGVGVQAVYAMVLGGHDETESPDPGEFDYTFRNDEAERFYFGPANSIGRQPVRVLRSHTLHSSWAPKAGIRYDGLYEAGTWSVKKQDSRARLSTTTFKVTFKVVSPEVPWDEVLNRPTSDELDDYREYKRLRAHR